jgi:hypothetical protein
MTPSPFITIWMHPRATVRRIITEHPGLHVMWLAGLAGLTEALSTAEGRPFPVVLVFAGVFGVLGGLFCLWLSSHVICWTGTWLGGLGRRESIETALAWATIPRMAAFALWLLGWLLWGADGSGDAAMAGPTVQPRPWILLTGLGLADLGLRAWSVVLLCHMIAEVQGFRSAWRGLGNLCLAGAVIIVPLLLMTLTALWWVFAWIEWPAWPPPRP